MSLLFTVTGAQLRLRVRVTVTVTAPGLPGPSQARLAADRETPNPETWPVWPQGHPKHTATLACHGSASGPGRPPGPGPFKFKLTPSPSRRCPFWPSQAEVTINNNKLEKSIYWSGPLLWERTIRLARNPVLNYILFGNFWSRLCRFLSLSHERSK